MSAREKQSTTPSRHVRVDLAVGLGLLAVAIGGKLLTDFGILAALGLR